MDVIVPDGVCGEWRIETFEVDESASRKTEFQALKNCNALLRVLPGTYKRLMRGNTVVMSNTRMEVITNHEIVAEAKGRVLINGLGLGMILHAVLKKPEVTEVWVVEKHAEVIALVGPAFMADPRVKIIYADALTYTPPKGVRFDVVWHDIWDHITADNLPQMHRLHRRYGRRAGWQKSWAREFCEARY